MSLLLVACAAGIALADPLVFRTEATVKDGIVRLADVADLTSLPAALRGRAAELAVGRIETTEALLSSREVSSRARAALPGLRDWLPDEAGSTIVVRRMPDETSRPALRIVDDAVEAGEALTLRVEVGPVTVERDVHALQAGQAGRPLFVRTADGAVLTVQMTAP